jgi:protocatechuate 3,4-dioxygenase alpha subunit
MSDLLTPSQTVGPFLSIGLTWPTGYLVVPEGSPGAIRISGVLFDGAGAPVPDGLIETWQASPAGTRGFGRSATDREGGYEIVTLKPGVVEDAGERHAPHLAVSVFARGLLKRAVTRIYFDDEAEANRVDPVLLLVDERARATLIATREAGGYRLDIHLQGERETIFFDV